MQMTWGKVGPVKLGRYGCGTLSCSQRNEIQEQQRLYTITGPLDKLGLVGDMQKYICMSLVPSCPRHEPPPAFFYTPMELKPEYLMYMNFQFWHSLRKKGSPSSKEKDICGPYIEVSATRPKTESTSSGSTAQGTASTTEGTSSRSTTYPNTHGRCGPAPFACFWLCSSGVAHCT